MEQEKKLSFFHLLSTMWWLLAHQMKLSKSTTILKITTAIIKALEPIIYTYIFAKIIDIAIDISMAGADPRDIIPALVFFFGYVVVSSLMEIADGYFSIKLYQYNLYRTPYYFYRHIHSLGIQTLEDPEVMNKIQRSKDVLTSLGNDFGYFTSFFAKVVTLIVAGVVIIKIMPLFSFIVLMTVVPGALVNKYFIRKDWELWRSETEGRRRAHSIYEVLLEASNLHEISVTSAYKYLSTIYRTYAEHYVSAIMKLNRRWRTYGFLSTILTTGVSIVGYFLIFRNFFNGLITIGDVTFHVRVLSTFINHLVSASDGYVGLQVRCLKIDDVKGIFEMNPIIADGTVVLPKHEIPPNITLKNVSFEYPRAENNVIKNLNLEIKPGEKIAIVGENGAGKTTLVRILSRFYKVSEGEILLDGTNINDVAIESWYKNLGVLFQDYNTYGPLTLKENIHLGNAEEKLDEERMVVSAGKANVNSFLSNFKNGYDQVLSEKFKGGTRPSTGQWQKIAIARFFYRNSPVVIFDEPTASIDAVSESEIFGQIYDFFKGKTVIIISHRFSTVRNADKIYVLDKGEIIESGSHDELMARKGKYHHAFTIQAEGYQA